jgi:hypothetical protein
LPRRRRRLPPQDSNETLLHLHKEIA